jgi:uncharacterized protein YdiU (UPF0061 family)
VGTMPVSQSYRPAPRILELGEGFYDPVEAARFPRHTLRFRNQRWAERVGLGELSDEEWTNHFARFDPLPENLEKPLALRYHGHQFAVYNPSLGDGRGFLFAQVIESPAAHGKNNKTKNRLLDLGTKGSGQTPYSRGADGRLTLKGGVREILATEMLEALGVTTSKTFSLVETGESLQRGDEPSPTRSSVLVRLNHSHIRFGSFQRHAYLNHPERIQKLLDFAVSAYMPGLTWGAAVPLPVAFLAEVSRRSGELCASFMIGGFVHGVLNTDNMNITGESFDYGPYRFLPTFDPGFTAAYFDHTGLYAFGRQPRTFVWNLMRLADALRPICAECAFEPAVREFEHAFRSAMRAGLLRRLGLASLGFDMDGALLESCFEFMAASKVGFDQFFFDWFAGPASEARALQGPAKDRYQGARFDALRDLMGIFSPVRKDLLSDPYFQQEKPCSLLIDEIEAIWDAITTRDDWSAFEAKVASIRAMGALYEKLQAPPAAEATSTAA